MKGHEDEKADVGLVCFSLMERDRSDAFMIGDDPRYPFLQDLLRPLYQRLLKKYGEPLGAGRHRVAFGNPFVVVKLPLISEGFLDNTWELDHFRRWKDPHYARCRLLMVEQVPLLVMERLWLSQAPKPSWADFIDCQQVGQTPDGVWKAYDYA